ncbi:MAG TPA: hydroxymethylbilane synthase [Flavitalea sp.]|nr:hydroxymethylbilane synthase [Flavitalea sp.]
MSKLIRIGTRESQLAVWQAAQVKEQFMLNGLRAELVYIKSEGDTDTKTPLYEMGVQGIFTRSLDTALLNNNIDIAVHSMKDVPTQLPEGIVQAAVLKRGPVNDLLVFKTSLDQLYREEYIAHIATSSIRRKAQWLHRFPHHQVHNLRGNVNTRLQKLQNAKWDAAIFAQAGLERIGLRPEDSVELNWMLPAPAQGAIMVVCRDNDPFIFESCRPFNDPETALCTKIERDFLRALLGGCSTPISALAIVKNDMVGFTGNILSLDGAEKVQTEKKVPVADAINLGREAALNLLQTGGSQIAERIKYAAQ